MTRVLLVDDAPDIRELLKFALELNGHTVVGEAENGLEGIEKAGETFPDVILLDLSMPILDGLEALPYLRRVSPRSRIIVLSAFSEGRAAAKAAEAGAHGYIEKGGPIKDILFALDTYCAV